MREPIFLIVMTVMMLNFVSFCLYQLIAAPWGAKFVREIQEPSSKKMNYLIAGMLNQPEAAYLFLVPDLHENITYAQFRLSGWNAKKMAEQIMADIEKHDYEYVDIYTISLGDHVARYLEAWLGEKIELRVIAINPCPSIQIVRQPLQTFLYCSPVFSGVCYMLGWLSMIPVIPTAGGHYSLILLADQCLEVAFDVPPWETDCTVGVVISRKDLETNGDGFLMNPAIKEYFPDSYWVSIDTNHGDTIDEAEEYVYAVERIFKYIDETKN